MTLPLADDTPVTAEPPPPSPPHVPTKDETRMDVGTTWLRPGCGCGSGGDLLLALAALAVGLKARRTRR